MAPSPQYKVDIYTQEWLAYKRDHWAPHPTEKKLDDALATSENVVPAVLVLLAIIARGSSEGLPWTDRMVQEVLKANAGLLTDEGIANEVQSSRSESANEAQFTCTVRQTWI